MRLTKKVRGAAMAALAATALAAWAPPALATGPDSDAVAAAEIAAEATTTAVGRETDDLPFGETTNSSDAVVAGTADVAVVAPMEAADPIVIAAGDDEAPDIGISLPVTASADHAQVVDGDTVYVDEEADTSFVVDAQPDGARVMSVLGSPNAGHEIAYDVDLPEGAKLVERPDGSVDISVMADGIEIVMATVEAPWAVGADGRRVSSAYRVDGATLTQVIEVSDDSAYPLTADPSISLGWYIYLRYSKSEIQRYWSGTGLINYGIVGLTCTAVGKYAGSYVGSACGTLLGAFITNWNSTFAAAKRYNQCVEVRMFYNGVPRDARRYSC